VHSLKERRLHAPMRDEVPSTPPEVPLAERSKFAVPSASLVHLAVGRASLSTRPLGHGHVNLFLAYFWQKQHLLFVVKSSFT